MVKLKHPLFRQPGRRADCHPDRAHRANGLCQSCQASLQRRRTRARAVALLGGKCVRCGITHPLAIDHVKNDAPSHGNRDNQRVWRAIIRGERKRYQLLCHNCNYLKSFDPDVFARKPTWRLA